MNPETSPLVETDWLATHLNAPDLVVFDASWHLPGTSRNAHVEFEEAHIPGALFFDIDEICHQGSPLPHMLPSTVEFASRMKQLGVGDGTRIVAYDADGIFSAARVWWMLRVMGHEDIAVLNGGLRKWKLEEHTIEDGPQRNRTPKHFTPRLNSSLIKDRHDILKLIKSPGQPIVDARPAGRFRGEQAEPRPGLRSGHIPGSSNIPHSSVLNSDGTMKPVEQLQLIFNNAGVDTTGQIIATCGSGVTASVLALALARMGRLDTAIYDGSWAEWGADENLPLATGA